MPSYICVIGTLLLHKCAHNTDNCPGRWVIRFLLKWVTCWSMRIRDVISNFLMHNLLEHLLRLFSSGTFSFMRLWPKKAINELFKCCHLFCSTLNFIFSSGSKLKNDSGVCVCVCAYEREGVLKNSTKRKFSWASKNYFTLKD